MESQNSPAVEAYLRETDRYKAFLVGYRPDTPSPESQELARKVEDMERKSGNVPRSRGESRGTSFNVCCSHIKLMLQMLTPRQQRPNFERHLLIVERGSYLL